MNIWSKNNGHSPQYIPPYVPERPPEANSSATVPPVNARAPRAWVRPIKLLRASCLRAQRHPHCDEPQPHLPRPALPGRKRQHGATTAAKLPSRSDADASTAILAPEPFELSRSSALCGRHQKATNLPKSLTTRLTSAISAVAISNESQHYCPSIGGSFSSICQYPNSPGSLQHTVWKWALDIRHELGLWFEPPPISTQPTTLLTQSAQLLEFELDPDEPASPNKPATVQ